MQDSHDQRRISRLEAWGEIRCPKCDFDMRAQQGDPRRCPECGTISSIAELLACVRARRWSPSPAETMPTLSVLAIFVMSICGAIVWRIGFYPIPTCILLGAVFSWMVCAASFARKVSLRKGWLTVMGWFALTGAAIVAVFAAGSALIGFGINSGLGPWPGLIFYVVIYILSKYIRWNPYLIARARLRDVCRQKVIEELLKRDEFSQKSFSGDNLSP